jgi:predicted homoserine dehydrogenase-like protein
MIIVDRALAKREAEGRPIRVAMVGAGVMGRNLARQIVTVVPGMDLVAISNRHLDGAARCYGDAGVADVRAVDTAAALEDAVRSRRCAISEDPFVLCEAGNVDVIVEATGTVEFAAQVAERALRHGKHLVLANAELDATVGPILKVLGDRAGVVITNIDGDQPGVLMNLHRFVEGIGAKPVLCGSIKTYYDRYATALTMEGFAGQWGLTPQIVASFTDGSKLSFEQAVVANATGMTVGCRGMRGPAVAPGTNIREAAQAFSADELANGPGLVDYVLGADPSPGVFVLGTLAHPAQRHSLEYYKMGKGPLYCFYQPYHLCHFEVPFTIGRAALFGDATIAPQGPPRVDVVTVAKKDLCAGDVLDGVGGQAAYGVCERAEVTREQQLLPLGLSEGCRLRRGVAKDEVLGYGDVALPEGRLCDRLRAEQEEHFGRARR